MYLDVFVKIPDVKGKITRKKKGNSIYINYEYGRVYDPERKFNIPQRATIGKLSKDDDTMMQPNQNYRIYFPGEAMPETKAVQGQSRSSCLQVGTHIVIEKIMKDLKIREFLERHMDPKDVGLFMDLVAYTITTENNAGQYYPAYAYHHPLFTQGMHIYSDSRVSEFLREITDDQSTGFLNDWNAGNKDKDRVYISYDSTNKNCQAGDIEMAEFGHAKNDAGTPIINYSVAYDTLNRTPLFYEEYPGSIVDVSQLRYMLGKAKAYGYKNVGFILDRGYFGRENIEFMDANGYDFIIMVKGMASFVNKLVLTHKGMFEEKRDCAVRRYGVYGMTVKDRLYASDEKERYFHIYYSAYKASYERNSVEERMGRLEKILEKNRGSVYEPGKVMQNYYDMIFDRDGVIVGYREKHEVVEKELKACGYYVIVTSKKMTAKEAIGIYKSRDASEKLFRGDKSYLGNRSLRVYTDEAAASKIFIEFVALIVRSRMYTDIKDEAQNMDSVPNYMNVPAAIRELEKIEMVRGFDGTYVLDHAVTAAQKSILKTFGITEVDVEKKCTSISGELKAVEV
jgi:transposase